MSPLDRLAKNPQSHCLTILATNLLLIASSQLLVWMLLAKLFSIPILQVAFICIFAIAIWRIVQIITES